jgi:hypothetical protein
MEYNKIEAQLNPYKVSADYMLCFAIIYIVKDYMLPT